MWSKDDLQWSAGHISEERREEIWLACPPQRIKTAEGNLLGLASFHINAPALASLILVQVNVSVSWSPATLVRPHL